MAKEWIFWNRSLSRSHRRRFLLAKRIPRQLSTARPYETKRWYVSLQQEDTYLKSICSASATLLHNILLFLAGKCNLGRRRSIILRIHKDELLFKQLGMALIFCKQLNSMAI